LFKPKLIIADLDGCCINSAHRTGHFFSGDHASYYAKAVDDTVIPQGAHIYRQFAKDPEFLVLYVTSRWDILEHRTTTLKQIRKFVYEDTRNEQLLMRPSHITGEDMPDEEMKPWCVLNAGYDFADVFMAFDDRKVIVDMWRKRGITCYETQKGDY
jgi:hypothetical protein